MKSNSIVASIATFKQREVSLDEPRHRASTNLIKRIHSMTGEFRVKLKGVVSILCFILQSLYRSKHAKQNKESKQ